MSEDEDHGEVVVALVVAALIGFLVILALVAWVLITGLT